MKDEPQIVSPRTICMRRIGFVLRFVLSLIGHVVFFFILINRADLWQPTGYPISDLITYYISHT